MNFNLKKIADLNYNLVTLSDYFPELKEFESLGDQYKQFEVLYQQDHVLLCAFQTPSRIEFFHMDLKAQTFEAFANLTGYQNENISLDVREMRMVYVAMAGEDKVRHGVFDSAWGAFKHSFYRPIDEDVLFLNHDYCLISKSEEAWQFDQEKWTYHQDKNELYLYEISSKTMYKIYDERLLNSWHTQENHHLLMREGQTYLINVPFNCDPYEYESLLKEGKQPLQVCDTNLSAINFDQFITEVKAGKKELSLESLLNFDQQSVLFTNMPELETETRNYGLFNFQEQTITRYIMNDELLILQEEDELSFSEYESTYNIVLNKDEVVVHQENKVDLLSKKLTIATQEHETYFYNDQTLYFFNDWSEDEQKDSYKEYLVIKDETGTPVYRAEGFYILVEDLKLLLEI